MRQFDDASGKQCMCYTFENLSTGTLVIVDGGTEQNSGKLREVIAAHGNYVNAWIITHFHDDHVGALCQILSDPQGITVGNIYTTPNDRDYYMSHMAADWDADRYDTFVALTSQGTPVNYATPGVVLDFDGMRVTFLSSYSQTVQELGAEDIPNNLSLVFRVDFTQDSLLFTGDCKSEALANWLISAYGDLLKTKYVQAAHHGNGAFSTNIYGYIMPQIMLIDAPTWLVQGQVYTTKDLIAWCDASGIAHYDLTTATNEYILY